MSKTQNSALTTQNAKVLGAQYRRLNTPDIKDASPSPG